MEADVWPCSASVWGSLRAIRFVIVWCLGQRQHRGLVGGESCWVWWKGACSSETETIDTIFLSTWDTFHGLFFRNSQWKINCTPSKENPPMVVISADLGLKWMNSLGHVDIQSQSGLFCLRLSPSKNISIVCSACLQKLYKRAENIIKWWSFGHPRQSLYHQMAREHLHGQSGLANETRWATTVPQPFQPRSVSTLLMKRPADGGRNEKK